LLHRTKRSGTVKATRKTRRLADTAEVQKGDIAPAEIAQAERD
jgi:hypothetical protein